MTYYDTLQQHNPQFGQFGQFGQQQPGGWGASGTQGGFGQGGFGLGQAAYGQQYGGQQPSGAFGYNPGWGGGQQGWGQQWGGQQRQLSPQDVNEVVRQLVPALPQILAQAQNPFGGMGAFGQGQRQLSPQDVNEVVRQILPIVPQIVGMLQSQQQPHFAAMQGGLGQGQFGGIGQQFGGPGHLGLGHPAQPWGTQFGAPQFQAAFGAPTGSGQQRQLTQQDVADISRQLIGLIPQVIGNLQAYGQQRII
jgi:hypothetical protein